MDFEREVKLRHQLDPKRTESIANGLRRVAEADLKPRGYPLRTRIRAVVVVACLSSISIAAVTFLGSVDATIEHTGPAAGTMSVFQDQNQDHDQVPRDVRIRLQHLLAGAPKDLPSYLNPGQVVDSRARVLIDQVGPRHLSLYGVPTDKGQVCVVSSLGNAGCYPDFKAAYMTTTSIVRSRRGDPWVLFGLCTDQVTKVSVIDQHGNRSPATMGNNAFVWESAPGDDLPRSVEVSLSDDRHRSIDLPTGAVTRDPARSAHPTR